MTTDLQPVTAAPPPVTTDQLDLIKRTVAHGATADELKLYLFDCARQGVHPLDKLIHFTVRTDKQGNRKYTPVTGIDFMRMRAADTGEYAGSDDPIFGEPTIEKYPGTATVTVYRLVQGQRCSFTGTARWSEYKPEQNDFMWRKMPHTMLSKCAEALALRKGFPRQLAGLYAREEMDQAETESKPQMGGYATLPAPPPPEGEPEKLPAVDFVLISRLDSSPTKNPKFTKYFVTFSDGARPSTINGWMASLAEQLCQDRVPVRYTVKETRFGPELVTLERADQPAAPETEPLPLDEIPF